jgi:sialate O-acetylesterase
MKLLSTLALLALTLTASAEVTLPKVFSSHMVLQRDMPIHIWGSAAPGEQVTVDLHGVTNTAITDNLGRWSLRLPAQSAGGPYTLTIHGTNTVQLDDILIGDLWIASGQSNMEMPLAGFPGSAVVKDADKEIAAANYPQIRLLLVEKDVSDYPLEDVKAVTGWSLCTPETAKNFSAVAYFFARALQQKEHVPIGLVDTTWGGTPAEAWTSLDALGADAALMPVFSARAEKMDRETTEQRADIADKQAKAEGKPGIHGREWHPNPDSWRPAALYNAMIAPFTPLPIRGVIWYQGEANSVLNRAPLYSRLFPAMIQDWRNKWRQGSFPFLFVQISAFGSSDKEDWGLLRDAQRRTLHLVDTGMAVTIDIGDEHNVHPSDKQTVGERLSLLARNIVFGENLVSSGPLFRLAYPDHGAMHVWFTNAAGLKSQGPVQGFEVAGADGKFVPATAKIEGDTIIATSPTISDPQYVRYAWPNFPPNNLFNGAGLPTSTFTSYPVP